MPLHKEVMAVIARKTVPSPEQGRALSPEEINLTMDKILGL